MIVLLIFNEIYKYVWSCIQECLLEQFKSQSLNMKERTIHNQISLRHYDFGGGCGVDSLIKNGKTSIGAGYSLNQIGPLYVLFKFGSYHLPRGK